MITTSLYELAELLGARLVGESCTIQSVSTDTRSIESGALFIALIGENYDAHDFCQQAKEQGAQALLVSRELSVDIPQLVVADTRISLGLLAAWVHQQCQIKTLAITGSCGKTTVKEMVAEILSQRGKVLATAGNFNNDIGVPLTLLHSTPDHDYAVIELGANHLGEIAYTSNLVQPSVALVNNVAAAHLEGFGSLEGVKIAKGEIYQGLTNNGTAVVNLDSQGDSLWHEPLIDKHRVTFSVADPQADFYASEVAQDPHGYPSFTLHTPQGSQRVSLSLVGRHNIANALAAAALAVTLGASLTEITHGLSRVVNVKGRVEVSILKDKIRLIDDSYNASVPAMLAAIDLLAGYHDTRWLILGNMAELGLESLALHRQVGEYAAQFRFDHVMTYGDDARIISEICRGQHFDQHDKLIEHIEQQLQKASEQAHTLLIKGANGARMSLVVEALKEKHS